MEGLHLSSTKEETVSYHEIVEGLHPSSTKEETVSYRNTEEVKAESYVKETTTRYELKPERDSKVEVYETFKTTKTASITPMVQLQNNNSFCSVTTQLYNNNVS